MFYANDHMGLHLSEEFWIAADALAGHRMIQSPTQQQVKYREKQNKNFIFSL
jgi:hypothetical protein